MIDKIEKLKQIERNVNKKKFLIQFLPQFLEDFLNTYKGKTIDYNSKKLKKTYFIDIIHNLVYKSLIKKDFIFNLSSEILKSKYGKNYNFYIKWLLKKELLFIQSNYMVGKKCKTFRLNKRLIVNLKKYKNEDKFLLKKHKNNLLGNEIQKNNSNWIQPWIRTKLVEDLFSIKIDYDLAEDILFTLEKDSSFYKNKLSVEAINNNDIFYTFDDYGRFHSNFTILKNSIREKCLKIDNQKLIEFDIKNSQPTFLSILLKSNESKIDKNELSYFLLLVKNAEFYDKIKSLFNLKTKREAKKVVYKIFFGKNKSKNEIKFKKEFPSIYQFILDYKKEKDDYKALAYELQRSESNFIFNDICKTLYTRYPDIKLLTVHDSISFPEKYKNIVKEIWDNKINSIYE